MEIFQRGLRHFSFAERPDSTATLRMSSDWWHRREVPVALVIDAWLLLSEGMQEPGTVETASADCSFQEFGNVRNARTLERIRNEKGERIWNSSVLRTRVILGHLELDFIGNQ